MYVWAYVRNIAVFVMGDPTDAVNEGKPVFRRDSIGTTSDSDPSPGNFSNTSICVCTQTFLGFAAEGAQAITDMCGAVATWWDNKALRSKVHFQKSGG